VSASAMQDGHNNHLAPKIMQLIRW